MNLNQILHKINSYEKLMRLDKPIGILLLLWPTLWALWLASDGKPYWMIVAIFVLGTVLMRSAGCVINDVADRNFDGFVERTKNRPIVINEVSVKEALLLAATLSFLAFLMILPLDQLVIKLSFIALILAGTYPYTKRFFVLPQAYLGIAFGFGAPMAYAAIWGEVPSNGWLLLLSNVFWSIAYDTEYAMVDREDDLKIGIKSSAIFFGAYDVPVIVLSYLMMLITLTYVGYKCQLGTIFFVDIGITLLIVLYHFSLIRNRDRDSCFEAFKHNNWIGLSIFLGIFFSLAFKYRIIV